MALALGANAGGVGDMTVSAGAGEIAGVAASVGFIGGLSKAGGLSLLGVTGNGAVALGMASAAAGAAAAKAWCDTSEHGAYARRLAEVQRHAPLTAAPGVDLGSAVQQLLSSFDWCLKVEEGRAASSSSGGCVLGSVLLDLLGTDVATRGVVCAHPEREFRRHLRRIWRLCAQPPPPQRRSPSGQKTGRVGHAAQLPVWPHSQGHSSGGSRQRREIEAYEKLFNLQRGAVTGARDACAALCFLVSSFLELRHDAPGVLRDAERASLRLAVAALARHPVFEYPVKGIRSSDADAGAGADGSPGRSDADREFRRGALALLCFLDAALTWRPLDPLGWMGTCDDSAGSLVSNMKGMCSYPVLARRLRATLKQAADGDGATWRLLAVQLDVVRARELPEPWPWVWVQGEDASMLVRNHTKVRLRVELFRPQSATPSPWTDWPLLRLFFPKDQPILTADVGPGIEWALRPRAREGRQFQMRLVTKAGVVVVDKRLRRGQAFDFKVHVPPKPGPQVVATQRALADGGGFARKESMVGSEYGGESLCSTTAPTTLSRSDSSDISSRSVLGPLGDAGATRLGSGGR